MPEPYHVHSSSESSAALAPLSLPGKQTILEELNRVLNSTEFHASPRCQEFLRYIVEHTVEGSTDLLKERNIGVDVFHRSPSYEPNSDSIVRVRATEVRKRLAQYYAHPGTGTIVRIAVAAGSYVPEFHWPSPEDPPVETSPPPTPPSPQPAWARWAWIAVPLLIAALLAARFYPISPPRTPLYDFWKPSLQSPNSVVFCLGQPVVYHLSRRVHEQYLKTQPPGTLPGPYVIPLKPGDIEASDIVPVPDQYVGAGSAQAAARLSALLAGWNKPSQVRIGNEVSFYDLRNYPAVLEGAFSNDWAMKMCQRMPFVFVQENGLRGVREKPSPGRSWFLPSLGANGATTEDYAVVSRVFDSGTMEPLVLIAGITQYGTQAAGEFISTEQDFAAAIAKAPANWRTRNLQILLHLNVIAKVPSRPEVIAVRTW